MNLYRVLDVKAELFGTIFLERTDESAKRAFAAAVADPQTPFHIAPEDYVLYRVGSEDDTTGYLEPCDPVSVWSGREAAFKRQHSDYSTELENKFAQEAADIVKTINPSA